MAWIIGGGVDSTALGTSQTAVPHCMHLLCLTVCLCQPNESLTTSVNLTAWALVSAEEAAWAAEEKPLESPEILAPVLGNIPEAQNRAYWSRQTVMGGAGGNGRRWGTLCCGP